MNGLFAALIKRRMLCCLLFVVCWSIPGWWEGNRGGSLAWSAPSRSTLQGIFQSNRSEKSFRFYHNGTYKFYLSQKDLKRNQAVMVGSYKILNGRIIFHKPSGEVFEEEARLLSQANRFVWDEHFGEIFHKRRRVTLQKSPSSSRSLSLKKGPTSQKQAPEKKKISPKKKQVVVKQTVPPKGSREKQVTSPQESEKKQTALTKRPARRKKSALQKKLATLAK